MPDIITSSRMRSGRHFSARTSACSPLGAEIVLCLPAPSSCSRRSILSGSSSTTRTVALSAAKVTRQLLEEQIFVDGLGEEIVAAAGARALLVAAHGVRRERDHRDAREARVCLQPARRLPAVHARQ